MKVTLFRDMKAEGWRSMDRYADALARELPTSDCQLTAFVVEPPVKSARVRTFWRNEVYPRLAGLFQGEINHVLDHSYAHLLKFLDPKKTIVTCHDLMPLEYEADPILRRYFLGTVVNLSKSALVLADSEATKREMIEKLSIDEGKIEVVYLGVDATFQPIDADEEKRRIRKEFNLPEGKIIFSHGQAHLPYKNTEGIVRAFAGVSKLRDDVYLLRVNSLTSEQKVILKSLGVNNRYREVINPSDEDLVRLYNGADVFLSPSFKEGFGLPVLQALACGLPVVISPDTSLEEIAGDCGVYVNPRDTQDIVRGLNRALSGGVDLAGFRKKAADRARFFSWSKTADKTRRAYEKIYSVAVV